MFGLFGNYYPQQFPYPQCPGTASPMSTLDNLLWKYALSYSKPAPSQPRPARGTISFPLWPESDGSTTVRVTYSGTSEVDTGIAVEVTAKDSEGTAYWRPAKEWETRIAVKVLASCFFAGVSVDNISDRGPNLSVVVGE